MARTTKESLELLRTSLEDIKTSLGNKEVVVSSLKASEVPDKIREIELGPAKIETGIIGFNVTENEPDPTNRINYNNLAIDRTPVVINFNDGTIEMDSWVKTWLYDKIYPAMVKFDGTIDYKLDRNDQTLKENGEPSDINNINYEGNAMTVFEKFYTKFGMDGENEVIQFSDTPQEGFEAIGFIREDGSEADWCASGMFMGTIDDQGKLRSIGNQEITYNTSFNNFRIAAQKCGTGYDIDIYAQNQVKSALEILMFKSCDWRNKLGEGRTYNNADNKKTGVLETKGAIAFDPTTKATKFLWMEDFVSYPRSGTSICRWEAGILCKNKENYVRMKPPYSGTDTSGYEKVTDHVYMQGYMNKMKADNKYGRIGVEASGAETTYETCRWYDSINTSGNVYISQRGHHYGVAGRIIGNSASATNSSYGAALSYLPPA